MGMDRQNSRHNNANWGSHSNLFIMEAIFWKKQVISPKRVNHHLPLEKIIAGMVFNIIFKSTIKDI